MSKEIKNKIDDILITILYYVILLVPTCAIYCILCWMFNEAIKWKPIVGICAIFIIISGMYNLLTNK